jgi:hypothetical protein
METVVKYALWPWWIATVATTAAVASVMESAAAVERILTR